MSADASKQVLDHPFRAPTRLEPPEEWARLRPGCPVAHVRLPGGVNSLGSPLPVWEGCER